MKSLIKYLNENSEIEVFLGGTCNNSSWREQLIPLLNINYFNPVVEDWTEDDAANEVLKRKSADYVLYVITPKMIGSLSIAEVIDDSNKQPEKTIFCVLIEDQDLKFTDQQMKSFKQIKSMIIANGGNVFDSLEQIANFLNG